MRGPFKLVDWRRGDGHAPLVVVVCYVETSFVDLEIEADGMARPDFGDRRFLDKFRRVLRDCGRDGKHET